QRRRGEGQRFRRGFDRAQPCHGNEGLHRSDGRQSAHLKRSPDCAVQQSRVSVGEGKKKGAFPGRGWEGSLTELDSRRGAGERPCPWWRTSAFAATAKSSFACATFASRCKRLDMAAVLPIRVTPRSAKPGIGGWR